MPFQATSYPGSLHHFTPGLVAFEYGSGQEDTAAGRINTLIFLGGLGDGLSTVSYSTDLSQFLPSSWCLVQPILSSSYSGWGISSLTKDVTELSKCVRFIRNLRPGGKIVLLGSSTGSQQVMHYLTSPSNQGEDPRPAVAGGILQAGISDREMIVMSMSPDDYEASIQLAQSFVDTGRGQDILPTAVVPNILPGPVSANRWLSLAGRGGEDDYFSSDLGDEELRKTFGQVGLTGTRLGILYGEKDEYVPDFVDKEQLVSKWAKFVEGGKGVVDEDSGVLPGGNHTLENVPPQVRQDFYGRIVRFLSRLGKQRI